MMLELDFFPEYPNTTKAPGNVAAGRRGQGLIEYIAVTALVAIVSIGTVKLLGNKVRTHLNRVTNSFDRTVRSGLHGGRTSDHSGDDDDSEDTTPARRSRNHVSLPGNVSLPW